MHNPINAILESLPGSPHITIIHRMQTLLLTVITGFMILYSESLSAQTAVNPIDGVGYGDFPVSFISPSDYGQHAQNWDVLQGSDGQMYFANTNGLMRYDGYSWSLLELPTTVMSLYESNDGVLYAGLTGDFGIIHRNPDGSLHYESIFDKIEDEGQVLPNTSFIDTYRIFELDGIIMMLTDIGLYSWDGAELRFWEDVTPYVNTDFESVLISQRYDGSLFMPLRPEAELSIADSSEFMTEKDGQPVLNDILAGLIKQEDGSFLALSQEDGRAYRIVPDEQAGSFSISKVENTPFNYLQERGIFDFYHFGDRFYITTFNSGIYEIDKQGNLQNRYTTGNGLRTNFSYNIHKDSFGVIWIVGDFGISKIYSESGVSVLNAGSGLAGNNWIARIFGESFYVGTTKGLYKADMAPNSNLEFKSVADSESHGVFTSIEQFTFPQYDKTAILAFSENGLYEVKGEELNHVGFSGGEVMAKSSRFPNLIFTNDIDAGLRAIRLNEDDSWTISEPGSRVFKDAIMSLAEDENGNFWFSTYSGGLSSIVFKENDTSVLPDSAYEAGPFGHDFRIVDHNESQIKQSEQVYFSQLNERLVFIQKDKIFEAADSLNYENVAFNEIHPGWLQSVGEYDDGLEYDLLDLIQDSDGSIWYISRINDEIIFGLTSAAGRSDSANSYSPLMDLMPGFHSRLIHCESCGHVFLINAEDIYAINYADSLEQSEEELEIFLTKVETSDGELHEIRQTDGQSYKIFEYEQANPFLQFNAATNYIHNAKTTQLSFRLNGVDKTFTTPDNRNFVNYRGLNEGTYTLEIRAMAHMGEVVQLPVFRFVIQPPWYRSLVAYIIYLLLTIGLIYGIVVWRLRSLQSQRDLLSRKVLERTAQLQQQSEELSHQRDQLTQANLLKVRLLRMTAHDLRSPLTAILGYSGMIEIEESKEEMKEYARTIHTISTRMRAIVQRMLASGARNLEQIELELEEVGLEESLNSTINQLNVFLVEKNQSVKVDVEDSAKKISILADPIRLSEIFENLLSNAIKYSPSESEIYIRLRTDRNHKNAFIEVSDQGPGFSEKDMEAAFGEYKKLSATPDSNYSSIGLGLFIVRQLMMAHGGSIEVQNSENKNFGACFILSFPLSEAAPDKASEPKS